MKTILSVLIACILVLPAWSQVISQFPGKYALSTNDVFLVSTPGVATYKVSLLTLASNLNGLITVVATVTNAVARGSNLATTNSTSFGVFYQVSGLTNMEFFNLKQGTNMVLYRDGSNIVFNATGTGSGGGGAGSLPANSNQLTTNTSLTIKDGALTTNLVIAGVAYIDGIITAAGTNINAFYGSNYFGGRVQIAVGSPGAGKVLTSGDVDGNATWETPTGGGSLITNANQFGASTTLTLKNGLLATNPTLYGSVTLPGITALRPAFINSAGIVTNVSGTPDGTKYVRDDGVLSTPSGAGDVTTAQLNTASNSVVTILVANDITTSNELFSVETTRNAAVSNGVVSLIQGHTQMVTAAIGSLTVSNALSVGTLNANILVLTNFLTSNQVRLGVQQLTNVATASLAPGQALTWNSSADKWTNANLMAANVVSNIMATATNDLLLDFSMANIFKIRLLTNFSYRFTNAAYLVNKGYVYFQQDAVGVRLLNTFMVEGGVLQTNANMQPTTNALALDLLEVMPGLLNTNLICWWPQNFQPRVDFPGSAVATFTDNFDRTASDPMSTTASGGGTWTSGPGLMGDCLIEYNLLRGATATDNAARVLSPVFANNQSARIQLAESAANFVSTGPMVRIQSTTDGSGYVAAIESTTSIQVQRVTDNGSTVAYADVGAAFTVATLVVGDTVTLGISGSTLTLYINGVSQGTVPDSTFSTGQPGVWFFNTIGIAENFYATDL